MSQDMDIVDDRDEEWIDNRSKPELEFDDQQKQSHKQILTNLRILEWLKEIRRTRNRPVSRLKN